MKLRRRRGTWAFFADLPRVLPYLRPHRRQIGRAHV